MDYLKIFEASNRRLAKLKKDCNAIDLELEAMKKDNANFNSLMVDGGMVVNNWFCQQLSNILEVQVLRPKIIETTSLGAGYLAGLHAGVFENIGSLKTYKQIDETFNPLKESNRYKEWKGAVEKVLT